MNLKMEKNRKENQEEKITQLIFLNIKSNIHILRTQHLVYIEKEKRKQPQLHLINQFRDQHHFIT